MVEDEEETECFVCLTYMQRNSYTRVVCCGKRMHTACFKDYEATRKLDCPMCRTLFPHPCPSTLSWRAK